MELAQSISLDSEPKQFSESNQVRVRLDAAVNLLQRKCSTCTMIIMIGIILWHELSNQLTHLENKLLLEPTSV